MKKMVLEIKKVWAVRRSFLLLASLMVLCFSFPTYAQSSFPSVDAFKSATLKGNDQIKAEVRGDLNNDGKDDWVGVVQRQKSEAVQTNQLYVLLSSGQSGFRVAEKSKEAEIPGMGCCWLEDLQIKGASIYIQNNAKTASTMEAATHQFKFYRGEWRLVGLRIYYTELDKDTATETDMNIVTGAVIEKRQKGDAKPAVKRTRKRFPVSLLKNYDFSNGFGAE